MRRRPTGEQAELGRSALREMDEPVLVRRVNRQRYTLEYKPASPLTRSRLPPPPGHVMNILPESMKRPLVGERQWEILRRQRQDPPPQKDYWMLSPEKTELYRIHVVPRFHLFDVLAFHQEKGLMSHMWTHPKEFRGVGSLEQGLRRSTMSTTRWNPTTMWVTAQSLNQRCSCTQRWPMRGCLN